MKLLHVACLCVLASVLGAATGTQAGEREDLAVKVAEEWLAVVDAGDYAKSWSDSADLFKNAISQEKWVQSLTAVRKPLGGVISRVVDTARYLSSPPGAPDGDYVVIQFTTSFTDKKTAVETVTPMMDPDGQWRVSGYFIK